MIVWILLGLVLGLVASKIVSTTGEGTVVDILLGIVGAVIGGWLFTLFGGSGLSGFNLDSVYSAGDLLHWRVKGALRTGADADIVLLNEALEVTNVWARGVPLN